ncbi:MAG: ABC transporter ATP-binding protein [Shimia sp.]
MKALSRWLGSLGAPLEPVDGTPPATLARFFGWALGGAWPVIAMGAILSALAGASEVMTALMLGWVIDSATGTPEGYWAENGALVAAFLLLFLGFRPLAFAVSSAASSIAVAPLVATQAQARLHRWTMGQAVAFFDEDFAGRIAQKQMQTAAAITNVVVEVVNVVFFALASLIGSVVLLLAVDARIAAVAGLWVLGYAALIRWFLPRIRRRSKERAAARATMTGQIVDAVTNIRTVKLFAQRDHEDREALQAMEVARGTYLRFGELSALFRLGLMSLAGVLPVLLIGGTVVLWTDGVASPGDIAAAGAVSIRLAQMSGWVSFTLLAIYANVGEVEDGMRTLAKPQDVTDRPGAARFVPGAGAVAFEDATYTYGGTRGVKGVDLAIAPGEKVGIVGASGAGKSTLVALLLRLYDAEGGRVLIDGQDVGAVRQEELRRHISMVTQDTAMFNRSALDNIRYGRPDATLAEVQAAARKARAHDFVEELEDAKGRTGYDAFLGERGVKLSGGQRQRIALARAILKDAPILVLDEATSALDSEVEAEIQAALEGVMEGKTVLAIAHRLSTLDRMDRIVVFEDGRIVEEGTHAALLARDGLYARYWNRQSGGFVDTRDAAE